MEAGEAWLKATWGKFRNHERGLPQRLDRETLAGARAMFDYMAGGGPPEQEKVAGFLGGLTEAQRAGAGLFAEWIKANAEALKRAAIAAAAGDGAHTTDDVFVQLLR